MSRRATQRPRLICRRQRPTEFIAAATHNRPVSHRRRRRSPNHRDTHSDPRRSRPSRARRPRATTRLRARRPTRPRAAANRRRAVTRLPRPTSLRPRQPATTNLLRRVRAGTRSRPIHQRSPRLARREPPTQPQPPRHSRCRPMLPHQLHPPRPPPPRPAPPRPRPRPSFQRRVLPTSRRHRSHRRAARRAVTCREAPPTRPRILVATWHRRLEAPFTAKPMPLSETAAHQQILLESKMGPSTQVRL